MKLISMTDFVLQQYVKYENDNNPDCQSSARYILGTHLYAKFLKQPLTLGMFVPVSESGEVLEEPYNDGMNDMYFQSAVDEYQKAKSKVLFKNIELINHLDNAYIFKIDEDDWEFSFSNTKPHAMILTERRSICTIEQLANYVNDFGIRLEPTKSAIKQIGL